MSRSIRLSNGLVALAACLVTPLFAEEKPPATFACKFASGPIKIDGKADDAAWKSAQVFDHFYQPWKEGQPKARTATKARLLWDRENLYFLAEMDDADLFADVKEHDGMTWNNDVFELFFKPAEGKPAYYEFQVNAANTIMDMFLPQREPGGFEKYVKKDEFHLEAKVALQGTLNQRDDQDQGWLVEGRIPWSDFGLTGGAPKEKDKWKFTLCRYDYDVKFETPDLSACAPLTEANFHQVEKYATIEFQGQPERLGQLLKHATSVPSRVAGSPEPPLPYRTKRVMPELNPSFAVYVEAEPGTKRLYFIDQTKAYGSTRLVRTTEKPGEFESLFDFPEESVAYSLAFHPKYAENGYLYVGWNGSFPVGQASSLPDQKDKKEKRSLVTRFTIDRKTQTLLKDSALEIISWASDGHNGAAIAFGHDGLLYITSGDGTSDSDTNVTGQGLDHLLAKLLRIDVDHPDKDRAYSVPKDNPFLGQKDVRPETFAYGFRNPWRITVDAKTGAVWVGQNGQDLLEQVYLIQAGANYGWSVFEGSQPFYPERKLGPHPHVMPTLEHAHSESRSLTGGVVYHGKKLPELQGAYIYGDYSTGKIWGAKVEQGKVVWHCELVDTPFALTCFAIDPEGELLIVDHRAAGEGGLYTLEPNPPGATDGKFPRKLSETGLFTSVAGHEVHPGLMPYDVNAPLWSDGAYKERYLYLPSAVGQASSPASPDKKLIPFDLGGGDGGWNLPDGTIAVKSFAVDAAAGRRWIETRLMVKEQGEWVGYSYAWNEEQTDATLVELKGADRQFETKSGPLAWHYPSRTECMVCHSRAANYVLGLSTPQFNRSHDYSGEPVNQLDVLALLGALKGAVPANAPKLVDPYEAKEDLTARVKSYLHANCAICHVEAGGGNSQMLLSWSTPLEKMKLVDALPVHAKFDRPEARLVAPGDPERSLLLHRMSLRGRGQMPQLATSVVDEKAVELIREWIKGLK